MKGTIIMLSCAVLFTISSCKKADSKKTQAQTEAIAPEKFAVDSIKVSDSADINNFLSVEYSSKLLVFPDIREKALLDSIYFQSKGITDFSKKGLEQYLDKEKNEYFASIKKENNSWMADLERKQTWNSDSQMTLKSNVNDFLHIEYFFRSYEGGAHDNYGFSERVFDLKNNKKVELKDITTMPKTELEALLRKNLDRMPSGTTDSQGAVKNSDMLLVDVIPANNNFYFDDKNLYFHYSPYEIAAFAAGDIVIPVSWEDMKPTLNPQFKERMKIK